MSFFKSIFIDLVFVIIYFIFYKTIGFELTVILGIAQLISHLAKSEYPKKPKSKPLPKGMKSVYFK